MHNPERGYPAEGGKDNAIQAMRLLAIALTGHGQATWPRSSKQEEQMSYSGSGTIRPLYGVIIRDKCKSADVDTLKAYKTVVQDLQKDKGPDAEELASLSKELDHAIAKYGKK